MARSRRFITPPATKTSIKNSYQLLCCAEDSFQIVCTHDLSIPPELLCPVHGSKGRICRLKHNALNKNRNHSPHEENRTVSVVRCFRPPAVRLCRKANPYIIKQHFKGSVGIEAFQSSQRDCCKSSDGLTFPVSISLRYCLVIPVATAKRF